MGRKILMRRSLTKIYGARIFVSEAGNSQSYISLYFTEVIRLILPPSPPWNSFEGFRLSSSYESQRVSYRSFAGALMADSPISQPDEKTTLIRRRKHTFKRLKFLLKIGPK